MPTKGTAPEGKSAGTDSTTMEDYFTYSANLTACQAYPDLDIAARMEAGFAGGSPPPGYGLDVNGKVGPLPPGPSDSLPKNSTPIDLSAGFVRKANKVTHVGLEATITCDAVAYDRDKYAAGDPEAIASVHTGDTVQYVGHVTVADQEIILIHGRKGYVSGCVDVKQ